MDLTDKDTTSDSQINTHDVEDSSETNDDSSITLPPSRDWQVDKSLGGSLGNVLENSRWTDMVIRCGANHETRDLKAHKVILAARSPVFEAMLFGPCSEQKTEYEFPNANVDIFEKLLR